MEYAGRLPRLSATKPQSGNSQETAGLGHQDPESRPGNGKLLSSMSGNREPGVGEPNHATYQEWPETREGGKSPAMGLREQTAGLYPGSWQVVRAAPLHYPHGKLCARQPDIRSSGSVS